MQSTDSDDFQVPLPPVPGDRKLRVNNVMARLNVTDSDIRYLARHGKLKGFKVGKLWYFWLSDVLEYQRRATKSGRIN